MKKLILTTLLLIPLLLAAANLSLNLRLEAPRTLDEEQLQENGYGFLSAPGYPRLPYKTVNILLPGGSEIISQSAALSNHTRLAGDAPQINQAFSSGDQILSREGSYQPQERVVCLGMKRWGELSYLSYRVIPADFRDGAWNWQTQLSVNIDYSDPAKAPAKLPPTFSDRAFFANPEALSRWYDSSRPRLENYLIISNAASLTAAQSLLTYRDSQFDVFTKDIAEILVQYPGANPAEKVRNYLIEQNSLFPFKYLLLIGDVDVVPTAYLNPQPNGGETVPSDFYYSDLSSVWDTDNDGRLGEYYSQMGEEDWLVDYTPECFVGRISSNNSAEISAICDRIVAFEQTNAPWKRKALLPAAYLNYHDEPELGFLQTDGAGFVEYLKATVLQDYQTFSMYEQEGFIPSYPGDLPLNYDALKNKLSTESWGILNWSAHGSATSSSRRVWVNDIDGNNLPDSWEMEWMSMVNRQSFNNLSNTDGTVLFAASCNNGMLDGQDVSLGEYSLIKKTVASLAATRTGWYKIGWRNAGWGGLSSYNYHWLENYAANGFSVGAAHGFTNLLHTQIYLFGDPVDSDGIIYPELQNIYTYMLFGDPAIGYSGSASMPEHSFLIYEPTGDSAYRLQSALHAMETAHESLNDINVVITDVLIPVGAYNPESYLDQFDAIFCLFAEPSEPHFIIPFTDEYNQLDSYLAGGGKLYLEGPGDWGALDGFFSRFRMHQPLNTIVPIEGINAEVTGNPNWSYTGEELVSPFIALPGGTPLFMTTGETPWQIGVYTPSTTGDIRTIGSLFRLANVEDGSSTYQQMVELIVDYLLFGGAVSTNDLVQQPQSLKIWPNPFNPSTTISFDLAGESPVTIGIYNLRGQQVYSINEPNLPAGTHSITFRGQDQNGSNLPSGIYFIRMQSKQGMQSRKLILLK